MFAKSRWNRTIALVILASLLVGCGAAATPTQSPQATATTAAATSTTAPTTAAQTDIKMWGYAIWTGITGTEPDGKGEDYWNYKSGQVRETHPNVNVALEMLDPATYKEKLGAALNAGDQPDVMWMCSGNISPYADMGALEPLESYVDAAWKADVPEGVWQNTTYRGHYWYFPTNVFLRGLIINQDLFNERGVPIPAAPDRAWTWDEFDQALDKLTFDRDGDGRNDVYSTAICAVNTDMEWYNLHYMFNRGAHFMDPTETKFTFNDQKAVDACQWMLDLQDTRKVVPPGGAGLSIDDCDQMLYQGKVAIFHGAADVIANMEQMVTQGQLEKPANLIMVQYPHFPGEHMTTDLDSCGIFVFKNKDPNKTAAAVEFAKSLTTTESLREYKAARLLPARISSATGLYEGDQAMTVMSKMMEYGDGAMWSRVVDIYLYANQMNAIIPSVLNHAATCKQALDTFVSEAQAIFDANAPKP
jgi:multiple sugar transport system substrate-binding protein